MSETFKVGDKVNILDDGRIVHKNLTISKKESANVEFEGKHFAENVVNLQHVKVKPKEQEPEIKTQYAIASSNDMGNMSEYCEEFLKDGWTPLGGISVTLEEAGHDTNTDWEPAVFLYCQSFAISHPVDNHLPNEVK